VRPPRQRGGGRRWPTAALWAWEMTDGPVTGRQGHRTCCSQKCRKSRQPAAYALTNASAPVDAASGQADAYVSVPEAARLLGRDRTRVYALIRSGDLVAVQPDKGVDPGPLRIDRASLDADGRWGSNESVVPVLLRVVHGPETVAARLIRVSAQWVSVRRPLDVRR
jgi:Helix-turn-helix domain